MKNTFVLLACCLFFLTARADQKLYLTKYEADKAAAYLKLHQTKKIVAWCGCCEDEKQALLTLETITTKLTPDGKHYQLILTGRNETKGYTLNVAYDLAYLWVQSGDLSQNLAQALNLKDVDPCALPFAWPEFKEMEKPTEQIFKYVEMMPEFPGNVADFLGQNLRYPEASRNRREQGRALVKFVVDLDGSVREIKILQSSGFERLDEEALRVVHLMPHWKAGTQEGKPVKVYMTLPVTFRLD